MAKGLIFDLDGTLIDTSASMISAYKKVCEFMKLEEGDYNSVIPYASSKTTRIFEDRHSLCGEQFNLAHEMFYSYIKNDNYDQYHLYSGIREMLDELLYRKIKMCIATARHPGYIDKIIETFDLEKYFLYIRINKAASEELDKSVFITDCAEKMLLDVKDCIMIGDSEHDVSGAKRAGCDSIWARYCLANESAVTKLQPEYVANNVTELRRIIIEEIL